MTMRKAIGVAVCWMGCVLPASLVAQTPALQPNPEPVSYSRLRRAAEEPGNWLMYSGQYNSQRFSRLDQINSKNVRRLGVAWIRQFRTSELFETTPLVINGVMYATLPRNKVMALDARTGLRYWGYEYRLPTRLSLCCGQVNRGVAILGETIYMGTLDAHLVALDTKTGKVIWDVEVGDNRTGFSITGTPLAPMRTKIACSSFVS